MGISYKIKMAGDFCWEMKMLQVFFVYLFYFFYGALGRGIEIYI